MKSIKAKRIAAVAASLLVGLAFASQGVNFGTVPIINSAGQPVVQIVVGSQAKPSDGVVAANIAAVIGSLAHSSQNITAYVSGRSGISCIVTTPTCTLSNQQVWLGEKGLVVPTGSYSFSALIGSVLNPGVLSSGNLQYTKQVQNQTGQFNYNDPSSGVYPITSNPTATSVYAGLGGAPSLGTPAAPQNIQGLSFTSFSGNVVSPKDNILQLTSSQVPGLLSSSGAYQESESLWLTGFPVYYQSSQNSAGQLSVIDANGAYQISFGKPIQNTTTTGKISAQFSLLGQNWTVYNMSNPNLVGVSSNSFVVGGSATFAQSSTPVETVYVGQNISTGPFKVVLSDLSYPNANGAAKAALSVYKNNVLKNVTSVGPGTANNTVINASGTKLYIDVLQTFPGLYAYQKWAKIQLFSNTFTVKSGQNFNSANGKNWLAALRWSTNESTSPTNVIASNKNASLEGIILYTNQSNQQTLVPGSSFSYITNPAKWNVNFVGDSLGQPSSGNANYDALQLSLSNSQTAVTYFNTNALAGKTIMPGSSGSFTFTSAGVATNTGAATANGINETVVTEPINEFTVSSSLPGAFRINSGTYTAPSSNPSSSVSYNLDPYTFYAANAVDNAGISNALAQGGLLVQLINNGVNGNYVSTNNKVYVYVSGYRNNVAQGPYPINFAGFDTGSEASSYNGVFLNNVTNIKLGEDIPYPGVTVNVYETANVAAGINANAVLLGTLSYSSSPTLLYTVPQYSYYVAPTTYDSVNYTGENGVSVPFTLSRASPAPGASSGIQQYYTYSIPEIVTPSAITPTANVIVDISNTSQSTKGSGSMYALNNSVQGNNAVVYESSQNNDVQAVQGFRTERGGEVGSIGTTAITYYEPKSVDGLQFLVGPSTTNTVNASTTKLVGPYTVGQATNIPNVTIGKVNATCAFSTTSCNVTGLNNLTAVPSATSAVVGSPLNTVTTPIAVLDSQASNSSNLIVIGSGYVNSVAQSIFNAQPSLKSSFGANSTIVQAYGNKILVAGYTAQQTVNAGNQFISQLLQDASS